MRRFLFAALLPLLLSSANAQAPGTLSGPDSQFDKGLYQEALKGYEARLKSPDEGQRLARALAAANFPDGFGFELRRGLKHQ